MKIRESERGTEGAREGNGVSEESGDREKGNRWTGAASTIVLYRVHARVEQNESEGNSRSIQGNF